MKPKYPDDVLEFSLRRVVTGPDKDGNTTWDWLALCYYPRSEWQETTDGYTHVCGPSAKEALSRLIDRMGVDRQLEFSEMVVKRMCDGLEPRTK